MGMMLRRRRSDEPEPGKENKIVNTDAVEGSGYQPTGPVPVLRTPAEDAEDKRKLAEEQDKSKEQHDINETEVAGKEDQLEDQKEKEDDTVSRKGRNKKDK